MTHIVKAKSLKVKQRIAKTSQEVKLKSKPKEMEITCYSVADK